MKPTPITPERVTDKAEILAHIARLSDEGWTVRPKDVKDASERPWSEFEYIPQEMRIWHGYPVQVFFTVEQAADMSIEVLKRWGPIFNGPTEDIKEADAHYEFRRPGVICPHFSVGTSTIVNHIIETSHMKPIEIEELSWSVPVVEGKRMSEVQLSLTNEWEQHPDGLKTRTGLKMEPTVRVLDQTGGGLVDWADGYHFPDPKKNGGVLRALKGRNAIIAVMAAGGNGFKIREDKLAWILLALVSDRNRAEPVTVGEIRALRSKLGK